MTPQGLPCLPGPGGAELTKLWGGEGSAAARPDGGEGGGRDDPSGSRETFVAVASSGS